MPDEDPTPPDAAETPPLPAMPTAAQFEVPQATAFVAAFLLVTGTGFAAVAGFNAAVDPRAEFGTGLLPPLVSQEVTLRIQQLGALEAPPRTLVVGDSRSLHLAHDELEALGPGPTLNFAISAATVHDALAVYRYTSDRDPDLQRVVYGVSLAQLAPNQTVRDELRQVPAMHPYIEDAPPSEGTIERLVASLASSYLRDSVRSVWYAATTYPTREKFVAPDTTIHRTDVHAELRAGTFDAADRLEGALPYFMDRYNRTEPMDQEAAQALGTLVHRARADGVTVHLFIPPVSAPLAQALEDTPFQADHAEMVTFLEGLCGPGVHLHDLHDAAQVGLREDRFFDPYHYFGENADRVGDAIASGQHDRCSAGS